RRGLRGLRVTAPPTPQNVRFVAHTRRKGVTVTEESKSFSRRTVVKGAAWSVPVIAAAVAMPLASASTINQNLDVTVSGSCTGQYDINDLQTLLGGVSLVGLPVGFGLSQLVDVVKAALAAININDGAKRGFNVSVAGDVLP